MFVHVTRPDGKKGGKGTQHDNRLRSSPFTDRCEHTVLSQDPSPPTSRETIITAIIALKHWWDCPLDQYATVCLN